VIETSRLILRDWRPEDVEPFLLHTNTPAVMRWLGGVKPRDEALAAIGRMMDWQEKRGFTFWIAERREDSALLGFCGIKIADTAGAPVEGVHEVGWRLREDAWGKGYAKEAAVAAIDHAFDRIGAPRLVALTTAGNVDSWGLMKRLGMSRRPECDYDDPRFPDLNPMIVFDIHPGELRR
jgi:RimJ/RimL family protein N-acetyltransferase